MEPTARQPAVRRIAKYLLFGLLFIILAIVGLTIYIDIKYPPERLKEILIARMADDYGIHLAIDKMSFNLFSGFELNHVAVLPPQESRQSAPAEFRSPMTVANVRLAYRLSSLLSRRLDIDEIIIEQPSLRYWQAPDSSTNLDPLLRAVLDSSAAPADTSALELPVSINLETVRVRRLELIAEIATLADTQAVSLAPIDLEMGPLRIDRDANLFGQVAVRTRGAALRYSYVSRDTSMALRYSADLFSEFECAIARDSMTLRGQTIADENRLEWNQTMPLALPPLRVSADGRLNLSTMQLVMPELRFELDGQEQFAARLEIDNLLEAPVVRFRIDRGRLDLEQVTSLLRAQSGNELLRAMSAVVGTGVLDYSGSEFHVAQKKAGAHLSVHGGNLAVTDGATGLKIDGAHVRLAVAAVADSLANLTASVDAEFGFGRLFAPIDTQTVLPTGPGELALNATLSDDPRPLVGEASFRWQDFASGTLRGDGTIYAECDSPDVESILSSLFLDASLVADAIELAPLSDSTLAGKISGRIELNGGRRDGLRLDCRLTNEELSYALEEYHGRVPPYNSTYVADLSFDSTLSRISFSNGILRSEPGAARFDLVYDLTRDSFQFDMGEAGVDLSQIMKLLPQELAELTEMRKIAGTGSVSGTMTGILRGAGELDYRGGFHVQSKNMVLQDTSLGFYADTVKIDSWWSLTPATISGTYSALCPSPRMPDYFTQRPPAVITSGELTADERAFAIEKGKLDIPLWQIHGQYEVDGQFLPEGMEVQTTLTFNLETPDEAIAIDRGITLKGKLTSNVTINQFIPDESGAPQPARLTGEFRAEEVHIAVDTVATLSGLQANVSFDQEFVDWANMVLKSADDVATGSYADAGEALLLYDIFGEPPSSNGSQSSRITVAAIEVLGYQATDIDAILKLGNSRLEIPQVRMNLFGGNLIGNLQMDFGNGEPSQVRYSAAAQISSIDVSRFRRLGAEVEKGSRLSADFYMNGMGASPDRLDDIVHNLTGRMNITKIEKKVASNLLQTLDPNGTDAGIQRMRLLLKTGWNVKHMNFEIKNGFVYASLAPIKVKPWSALFKLPATVDFARLPVKLFLDPSFME